MLASLLPLLDYDVAVVVPAPSLVTLRGNDTFRIVETRAINSFSYVVFRDGTEPPGGAIFNRGKLTLSNCTLTSNVASVVGSAI